MPIFPPTSAFSRQLRSLAGERSGSGLAVGPGDRNDFALQESRGQFNFANHWNPECSPARSAAGRRNSRADDDQVLLAERALAVAAGFNGDALSSSAGISLRNWSSDFGVGNSDRRRAPSETTRKPRPTSQSDHQNLFPFTSSQCSSRPLPAESQSTQQITHSDHALAAA